MNEKVSKGLTHKIIATYIIIVAKPFELRTRFDDRDVSGLHTFSYATREALRTRPRRRPRIQARGVME